jgi:hypothetical protein
MPVPSLQERFKNVRDLEDGSIVDGGSIGVEAFEVRGIEQFGEPGVHFTERFQHHAYLLIANPIGIETFLWERPCVAFHHDGQFHRERFADTARPRFADEEIGQSHEMRDLGREALDRFWKWRVERAQFLYELLILPAYENELQIALDAFCDVQHRVRPFAAEQNKAGREIRLQPELSTLCCAIDFERVIEFWTQNHARRFEDPIW